MPSFVGLHLLLRRAVLVDSEGWAAIDAELQRSFGEAFGVTKAPQFLSLVQRGGLFADRPGQLLWLLQPAGSMDSMQLPAVGTRRQAAVAYPKAVVFGVEGSVANPIIERHASWADYCRSAYLASKRLVSGMARLD